jgi:hypothetical protein
MNGEIVDTSVSLTGTRRNVHQPHWHVAIYQPGHSDVSPDTDMHRRAPDALNDAYHYKNSIIAQG